jgi:uncharacterized GH25 family protein
VTGRPGVVDRQTLELQKGAEVAGKVVDARGKPVAGARVRAAASSALFGLGESRKDRQVTDAAGAFTLPPLPAGTFRVHATHEAHGPGTSAPLTLDGKTPRRDVIVTLEEGGRVAGKVVRPGGEGVPGAAVRVVRAGRELGWDATRQVFTDEAGRFDITGLPRKPVELVAIDEQASSKTVPVDLAAKPEHVDLTITLEIAGAIAGTVVTPQGEPVPEAQVMAMPDWGDRRLDATEWRLRGVAQDVTDSGGRFELTGLVDGEVHLRASRGRGGEERLWQREPVAARVGDRDVKLVLADDGKVKGSVLFADGTPPESFRVSAGFGRGAPFGGDGGRFELEAPAGPVVLRVTGPALVQKTVADVAVKAGETTDVGTITVEKGRSVSGRVLRADGGAVAGAKVLGGSQLMGTGSDVAAGGLFSPPGQKSTTSGEDGGYVLAGVGARGLVLVADHPTEGRSNMVRVPGGDTSVTVDLVVRASGALEGKVTAGGKPLPEAVVMATPQQAARGTFMVQSGEDGSYRYDKLSPDTYRVTAMRRAGMLGASMHSKVVTVEAETTARVDLEVPASGISVVMAAKPPAGVTLSTAQLFLVSGTFRAPNAEVFTERFGELGAGATHQGFMMKGKPHTFENVEPGSYSACAIPIPGDLNSPADMLKVQENLDKLLVACQPVTIAASPTAQEIAVEVPAPPPI